MSLRSTDYILTQDKSFKKYAKSYADDQEVFFKESVCSSYLHTDNGILTQIANSFSAVVSKLFELGVPKEQFASSEPWILKSSDEQSK